MLLLLNKYTGSILVFLTIVFLAACGSTSSEELAAEPNGTEEVESTGTEETESPVEAEEDTNAYLGDYEIDFKGEVIEESDSFIVKGESNLLPGARLTGEVVVDDGETVFSDTSELVQDDGSFYMELEHHQYGEAEIIIRFDFDSVQEDEIKRHYGEEGQNLEGPFVYKHSVFNNVYKKAEVILTYEPNTTNDLTIQAPEWNELPEDYGDPRVWIEDVEITDDGEFFYVHGKSNLLEGSEIVIEYRYNRDRTRVLPDGTFQFKLDYEYLEDYDFVITFTPSSHTQWNEIVEAYGQKGQKLVGNLVVQDKYSDRQYIEKVIPYEHDESEQESINHQNDEETLDEETSDDE